jgi:hypothetical protein
MGMTLVEMKCGDCSEGLSTACDRLIYKMRCFAASRSTLFRDIAAGKYHHEEYEGLNSTIFPIA